MAVSKYLRTNGGLLPDPKEIVYDGKKYAPPSTAAGKRIFSRHCHDVYVTIELCLSHRGDSSVRLNRSIEEGLVALLDKKWHGLTGLVAKCLGCSSRHVKDVRKREKKDSIVSIRVNEPDS